MALTLLRLLAAVLSTQQVLRGSCLCGILLAIVAALLWPSAAPHAQDLEPRAYSAAPVGANFLPVAYSHSTGDVLVDPSLPVTNVDARIDAAALGYVRTFGLFGRSASLGAVLPYVWLNASGEVAEEQREVSRAGFGDPRLRFSMNLLGGPALRREAFATRTPTTTLGASLSIVAPFGQYDASRLINIGSNRWAFKPEVGLAQPLGNVFLEASAGVWLFMDNTDFFGGQRREQKPLWTFQLHGGYTFRPGLWLAGNATYYTGGQTRVNGVAKQDRQANSRYGLTLSVPLWKNISAKLAWSTGFTTRAGGDFDTFAVAVQYLWFDP